MFRLAFAGAIALVLSSAAYAADSKCTTQADVDADTKRASAEAPEKHIHIAGAANYSGAQSDALLIVQGGQEIMAFVFEHGCLVNVQHVDDIPPGSGA